MRVGFGAYILGRREQANKGIDSLDIWREKGEAKSCASHVDTAVRVTERQPMSARHFMGASAWPGPPSPAPRGRPLPRLARPPCLPYQCSRSLLPPLSTPFHVVRPPPCQISTLDFPCSPKSLSPPSLALTRPHSLSVLGPRHLSIQCPSRPNH